LTSPDRVDRIILLVVTQLTESIGQQATNAEQQLLNPTGQTVLTEQTDDASWVSLRIVDFYNFPTPSDKTLQVESCPEVYLVII